MNQDSRWYVRAIERLDTRRLLSAEDPNGDGELVDPPLVDDPTITVDPNDTTGTDPLIDLGIESDILIYTCFFPTADGGDGTDGGDVAGTDGGGETIDPNVEPVIFTCGTGIDDSYVDENVLVDPNIDELYPTTDEGVLATVEEPAVEETVSVNSSIEEVERTSVDVIDVEATSVELTSAPQVAEQVDEAASASEVAATATATFSNTRIRDSFELIASSDVLA